MQTTVRIILEEAGYEISTASDGDTALNIVRGRKLKRPELCVISHAINLQPAVSGLQSNFMDDAGMGVGQAERGAHPLDQAFMGQTAEFLEQLAIEVEAPYSFTLIDSPV